MNLSRESKMVSGILLITIPTIMYGGLTLLGILTEGQAGLRPGSLTLNETQWSLWRAGHAHAGVFVLFSLIIQPLVDQIDGAKAVQWVARLGAPVAAIMIPAGFFRSRLHGRLSVVYSHRSSLSGRLVVDHGGRFTQERQSRHPANQLVTHRCHSRRVPQ